MMPEPRKLSLGRFPAALAVMLGLCLAAHGSPKYKVLHNFTGGADGDGNAGVVLDQEGNLYGASLGGGNQNCRDGCGLIFELTPGQGGIWTLAALYDFTGGDGEGPSGNVAFGPSGNLYGTTTWGGAHGYGTAFELTLDSQIWQEAVLFSFPTPPTHRGCCPEAGVVLDGAGNLYGTAGIAYELKHNPDGWKEIVLHDFTGKNGDGDGPFAGLILDAAGNLYSTTQGGGNQCGSSSCGTVYELTPESGGKWKETVLHRFDDNGKDGITPGAGALLMDSSLNLYGTTEGGGCCGGVVYKLTPKSGGWKETILYAFQGGQSGNQPYAGVVMDKSGNLYGTTDGGGGPNGCGVIYKLAPAGKDNWKYSVLHTFGRVGDGCVPAGNLAIDGKGNLYGGTVLGGTKGYGVVFELTP